MTPSEIVVLDEFPLTPNGKVDLCAPARHRNLPETALQHQPKTTL